MIVLDASIVGPLMLPDEQETLPPEVILTLLDAPMIVPMHWHLEVASILQNALRRGRITLAQRAQFLRRCAMLGVEVDSQTARLAWSRTMDLADRHQLTCYDAAYLELALRIARPLASVDRALVAAAKRDGLSVISVAP